MPHISTLAEATKYLARYYKNARAIYSLDNIRALMDFLDNPQEKFKVIHVAGTSGKTSTAYYVSALLTAAGQKTGLTVSPHVDQLNERLQINGVPVAEAEFCQYLNEFLALTEQSPIKPSWFELIVAFAYWYFAKQAVDYAVVEVGLGGQRDGTNIIKRADKICVITDIGLDHVGILGDTIQKISQEKAGIIQQGNVVFCYEQSNEIIDVIKKVVIHMNGDLHLIHPKKTQDFKLRNWSLAESVFSFLQKRDELRHLTSQESSSAMDIYIPGRMDIKQIGTKTLIMDGAHNDQKMIAFLANFRRLYPDTKPAVLIAVKNGKEYKALVSLISAIASRIITTNFTAAQDLQINSMDSSELAQAFVGKHSDVQNIADQKAAYQALVNGPESIVVITGSFYLLGQIRNNEHLA